MLNPSPAIAIEKYQISRSQVLPFQSATYAHQGASCTGQMDVCRVSEQVNHESTAIKTISDLYTSKLIRSAN